MSHLSRFLSAMMAAAVTVSAFGMPAAARETASAAYIQASNKSMVENQMTDWGGLQDEVINYAISLSRRTTGKVYRGEIIQDTQYNHSIYTAYAGNADGTIAASANAKTEEDLRSMQNLDDITTYQYDPNGMEILNASPMDDDPQGFQIHTDVQYNNAGQIIYRNEASQEFWSIRFGEWTQTYDKNGRLSQQLSYENVYDESGAPVELGPWQTKEVYTYNKKNQLTKIRQTLNKAADVSNGVYDYAEAKLHYDKAGNLISADTSADGGTASHATFTYNADGTIATISDGYSLVYTFIY